MAGVAEGGTGVDEGVPDDSKLADDAACLTTEDQVGGEALSELTSEELLDETTSVRPAWEVVDILSDWLRIKDRAGDEVSLELSAWEVADETASVRLTLEVVTAGFAIGGTGVKVPSDWLRTEDRAEDLVHSELSAVEL